MLLGTRVIHRPTVTLGVYQRLYIRVYERPLVLHTEKVDTVGIAKVKDCGQLKRTRFSHRDAWLAGSFRSLAWCHVQVGARLPGRLLDRGAESSTLCPCSWEEVVGKRCRLSFKIEKKRDCRETHAHLSNILVSQFSSGFLLLAMKRRRQKECQHHTKEITPIATISTCRAKYQSR